MEVEEEYVRKVYSCLASFSTLNWQTGTRKLGLRSNVRWSNVAKFVDQLLPGSIGIDIGCGETKYHRNDCFFMGCDVCIEILAHIQLPSTVDLQLADALSLPYRSESIDAALLVSILHHLSTLDRRKQVLVEVARCLRPRGQVLIYVWAFEQPNGVFPSQDVLVPWHLHENIPNGKSLLAKFHINSTKEERTIRDSIALKLSAGSANFALRNGCASWRNCIRKFFGFANEPVRQQPTVNPGKNTPKNCFPSLVVGNRCINLKFSKRRYDVIELFAMELTQQIVNLALMESLSTMQKITLYRFYHVFKKGELETLIAMVPSLRLVSLHYEHANWWAIAEKVDALS